jgi:hypothetical protein
MMMEMSNDIMYNNYSQDKLVGFQKDGHKYIHTLKPELNFTSVTTLITNYKEKFDGESVAKKCVKDPKSKYYGMDWQQLAADWVLYGSDCADKGTELHGYGEQLFHGKFDIPAPDSPRAAHAVRAVRELLSKGYKLATTELLVYSDEVAVAGQSDILLKKRIPGVDDWYFMIYDWKFLSKPLQMKSYYRAGYGFKMMSGPFCKLMDCNWIHYSIQLALYQTLVTTTPSKITEKVMIVVNDDGYKFVPAYPMRVFWDQNNELQCVHEVYNGRWYDSRMQQLYKRKPKDIQGI